MRTYTTFGGRKTGGKRRAQRGETTPATCSRILPAIVNETIDERPCAEEGNLWKEFQIHSPSVQKLAAKIEGAGDVSPPVCLQEGQSNDDLPESDIIERQAEVGVWASGQNKLFAVKAQQTLKLEKKKHH